jgi:hypothetical protein
VGQTRVLNLSEDLINVFFVQYKEKTIINIYPVDDIADLKQAMVNRPSFKSASYQVHVEVFEPC